MSKILEKCILENFSKYLTSSNNQFGFKKETGCAHAIYCLRSTIDHFCAYGSTVNVCSLDVSKAFDRVNHFALLGKLMVRRVPVNIVALLLNWFSNSYAMVSWAGVISGCLPLRAGVRQGGVLSPILFSVYIDCVILALQKKALDVILDCFV